MCSFWEKYFKNKLLNIVFYIFCICVNLHIAIIFRLSTQKRNNFFRSSPPLPQSVDCFIAPRGRGSKSATAMNKNAQKKIPSLLGGGETIQIKNITAGKTGKSVPINQAKMQSAPIKTGSELIPTWKMIKQRGTRLLNSVRGSKGFKKCEISPVVFVFSFLMAACFSLLYVSYVIY